MTVTSSKAILHLGQYVKHGIGRLTATATANNITNKTTTATATSTMLQSQLLTKEEEKAPHQHHHQQNHTTRLTRVSHKAPTRLLPMTGTSSINQAGAAICALSNYGGGMLQGDSCELSVHVQSNAKLGIVTQGASRIYKKKKKNNNNNNINTNNSHYYCKATLEAQIDEHALFVLAPDPCSLFAQSSFVQEQNIYLHPNNNSNIAILDWFSSGRYRNGESWAFDSLQTTTRLWMNDQVFLQDATHMDMRITTTNTNTKNTTSTDSSTAINDNNNNNNNNNNDPLVGVSNCHTFASLILYGDQVQQVLQRCENVQDQLASQKTRIRGRGGVVLEEEGEEGEEMDPNKNKNDDTAAVSACTEMLKSLAGMVYLGISKVDIPKHVLLPQTTTMASTTASSSSNNESSSSAAAAYVIRMGATTNEDIYRIVHYCFQPLRDKFGIEFYKDRIRAKASEIPRHLVATLKKKNKQQPPASRTIISKKTNMIHHRPEDDNNNNNINNNNQQQQQQQELESKIETLLSNLNGKQQSFGPSAKSTSASSSLWSAYMLADSSMPTGSFAHSAGLEAAAQLGMIQNNNDHDVKAFIQAATRSTMQMTVPFLLQGHFLAKEAINMTKRNNDNDDNNNDSNDNHSSFASEWNQLNWHTQAALASNAPACAASLDQGKSLSRVAIQWLSQSSSMHDNNNHNKNNIMVVLKSLQDSNNNNNNNHNHPNNHLGPTLGVVSALLQLSSNDACHVLGYCIARDLVSAAVRLSLVGPLASVSLLHEIQDAANLGLKTSVLALEKEQQLKVSSSSEAATQDDCYIALMAAAGSSAPMIEAIHPCHDLLQTRLFRS